jgi:hypothetical protein
VHSLFAAIRQNNHGLVTFVILELNPHQEGAPLHRVMCTFPPIAPTYTGAAYKKALDKYTRLAQDFLGVHLNRTASRSMDGEELTARRARIDEEITRLAEPELAGARDLREKLAREAQAYARTQPRRT